MYKRNKNKLCVFIYIYIYIYVYIIYCNIIYIYIYVCVCKYIVLSSRHSPNAPSPWTGNGCVAKCCDAEAAWRFFSIHHVGKFQRCWSLQTAPPRRPLDASAVYPAFPTDDEARRPAVGVILQTKYGITVSTSLCSPKMPQVSAQTRERPPSFTHISAPSSGLQLPNSRLF